MTSVPPSSAQPPAKAPSPRDGRVNAGVPGARRQRADPWGPGERSTALLQCHAAAWQAATWHPFLVGVREGTLPTEAFRRWLEQDYLFVGDLLRFQARLLVRAPRPAQAVLTGGLVALEAELTWFEQQMEQRGLQLGGERHAVTIAYNEFLAALDTWPYAAAITALWALERAYLEAWRGAAPGAPEYRAFVEHWTVPVFGEYVDGLEEAAEAAMAEAGDGGAVARAFLEVARLEALFWAMTWQVAEAPAQ